MNNYLRFSIGNTSYNSDKFVELMKDGNVKKVTLFATPKFVPDDVEREDERAIGPDNNLPLMSACVEYELPGVGSVGIVVDGLFLTAARQQRYSEVRYVLDEAEKLDNVYFSPARTSFTVCKDTREAFAEMSSLESVPFTSENRQDYFELLSTVPEDRF